MINISNDTINNLNGFTLPKNRIYLNNSSLIAQNPLNQISFLQKKRFLENENLKFKNQTLLQENHHFSISDKNVFQMNVFPEYYFPNFTFFSQLNKPPVNYTDNSYLEELKLSNLMPNYLNSLGKENIIENYFINNNINNVNFNLNGNHLNDFLFNNYYNQKVKENNNNITNDNFNNYSNINSNDSSNPTCSSSNKSSKKKVYFNVNQVKKVMPKKRVIKKNIKNSENNNEIKVLKNNKVVYVNSFLLNSYSTSKNIKKLNKIAFIGRNKRSSRYRGVSKNGNQWQVLMMINKKKSYIGSFPSEKVAARIYDILSLKNRGLNARTNFIYTSQQIKYICEIDIDIKAENIYEIITQLFDSKITQ